MELFKTTGVLDEPILREVAKGEFLNQKNGQQLFVS